MTDKWEYNIVYVSDEDSVNVLADLDVAGNDSWEFTGHVEDTGFGKEYYMKRKVPIGLIQSNLCVCGTPMSLHVDSRIPVHERPMGAVVSHPGKEK